MVVDELASAFVLGLLATITPCALPLYPGFLAYLSGRSGDGTAASTRWLGTAVLAGVLSMMLALGAVIALLQVAVGRVLVVVTPLADLVVIGLGVALILGRNPFARLPVVAPGSTRAGPTLSAYAYGLLYGPIALPCSGPLLVGAFTLSLGVASFAWTLLFFFVFGLGFGLPLLALSLVSDARRAVALRVLTRNYLVVGRLAGVALVAAGVYDLFVNAPTALLYLRG